ncbi:YtxH-like protein [Clostridium acetireducens DSM 10703]|jgi:gas vesicle protein|uniref:YtxH-like protein n=1 Tax=Clostridium acetireducens DSM 10703 TaxID=1121290 RepID=A0A1E8EVK9_9CLOT|nr:YtxH domain-containing protein [Clostridium acetireducens]OFI00003.1 YtxH-like protein [Clostridium acetireducens DSM 10703]
MNKFIRGITAGAVVGAVAGMMFAPRLDRGTRRRLRRSAKYMKGFAQDAYGGMRDMMR